jgi:hypothetical protein
LPPILGWSAGSWNTERGEPAGEVNANSRPIDGINGNPHQEYLQWCSWVLADAAAGSLFVYRHARLRIIHRAPVRPHVLSVACLFNFRTDADWRFFAALAW